MSFNKVILMGNLTRDPELSYTRNETAFAKFTIAVDQGWGEKKKTAFVDCVIWGTRAEPFHRFHKKGHQALVEGEITQDNWEDKKTGQKRSKLLVTVGDWTFAAKGEQDRKHQGGEREPYAEPPSNFGETLDDFATADADVPF